MLIAFSIGRLVFSLQKTIKIKILIYDSDKLSVSKSLGFQQVIRKRVDPKFTFDVLTRRYN